MKHTISKNLRIIILAVLSVVAAVFCGCAEQPDNSDAASSSNSGTVEHSAVILTESDYNALKDDWFPLLSTHVNADVLKNCVRYPSVDTEYYCVYTGIASGGLTGDLSARGQMSLTLDGGTDYIKISDCYGDLNFAGESFGSVFTPNEEKTALNVTQKKCGADFAINNEVTGFKFTVVMKFTLKKAGLLKVDADCRWKGKANTLPALEAYARYDNHVEISNFSLISAKESDCKNGEVPYTDVLSGALTAGQSYLICFEFDYNAAADQPEASVFDTIFTLNSANFTIFMASSGIFSETPADGIKTIKVRYSLSENSGDKKTAKIILKFTPERAGTYALSFKLEGEKISFTESAPRDLSITVN